VQRLTRVATEGRIVISLNGAPGHAQPVFCADAVSLRERPE